MSETKDQEDDEKREESESRFQGTGICVHMRGDVHMLLKPDAVLPPAVIEDMNAYQAECRLLDVLKNAGYRAEYSLDDENYPVVLHITIPAGKDMGGYPDKDEHLTITPIANEPSCHKFEIIQKLTEPSAQSQDRSAK
jgi:hypothetical protein